MVAVAESAGRGHEAVIEVVPVEIDSKIFPARPSSVPEIQEFLRACLAGASLTEAEEREVSAAILRALLTAAGTAGTLEVSCRRYARHVEVDVLPSRAELPRPAAPPAEVPVAAASFAEWLTEALHSSGLRKEAAAERLGVSVKTMNRWLGGRTEPRLRDLRRIQDEFGAVRLR
ncbi:helix-turn-helix domain-containing protein [Amycolatopsis sp. NPDC051758]|uniref:helix-turn-helix domain-containing protein n=1 Tax=Amycolatopsis sp. NPDC051758 TaxID=3363935 RepID=UPI0037A9901F